MKIRFASALVVLFALMSCQEAPTSPRSDRLTIGRASQSVSARAPGSYIVVLAANATDVDARAAQLAAQHGGDITFTYHSALKGFAGHFADAEIAALRNHPDVVYVEADGVMSIGTTQTGATWGIDRIDQRTLPVSGSYVYNATGAGVHAYIIDTGIRTTHTEFGGRASGAFDGVGDGNGTNDCNGHGTHVSATVGGITYGVAKAVTLHAVRVLGCNGSGATSGVIAGIDWVTANHISPAVANMSLGGGAFTALDQAVQNSIASGVTYAIAAGNNGADACGFSPSRTPEAITVGATDMTDTRASFSNFGTCLDIFGPGVNITSAWNGSDTDINTISGTSMATPHVAGTAALYLQVNPGATPLAVRNALVGNATTNAVINPGLSSPNTLLYSGFISAGPPNQPPVALFTASCVGLTCTFDASASTDDVGIVSYQWDFGFSPNGTGSGKIVTATYPHPSSRTVTLTVTDGGGLSNTTTQGIIVGGPVNQPPVAQFTVNCTNLTCTFDSSGSTDDNGIVSRNWTFGDGGTAGNVVAPSHTFAAGGAFTVSLTVADAGSLTNTKSTQVTVTPPNLPPVAQFTVSCTNLACTFDSSGSTDDNGIVSRSWTFGDGATAGNVVAPSHTFTAGGTFTVSLTVTDAGTLTNTKTTQVTVTAANQPPVAQFTMNCTNLACTFDSSGSTDDVGVVSRSWNFGDGGTAGNVVAPAHTYAAGGTFTVSLTVTDGGGLSNTKTTQVTVTAAPPVNQPPVARFTVSCVGLTCTLDASTSTDDVGIVTYSWDLGMSPNGSATGKVVTATYPHPSSRTVTLTVTDGGGLSNSSSQTFSVGGTTNQPPVAQFTASCTNLACTFDSSGSTDDVGIVSRSWTFGDGGSAGNVLAPSHTYGAGGTFSVTLTVMDGGGLSNSKTTQVTVAPANQPPVAQFTASCTNLACTFNSTGSTDDVGIVSRSWNFGDGATAGNVVSPSHTFAGAGTFTVSLTVTDAGGLSNTKTTQVTVTAPANQAPVANFTFTCTVNHLCTLDGTVSTDDGGIVSWDWDLDKTPDQFKSGAIQVDVDYYHTGPRTVKLTVRDAQGLTNSITKIVDVP